MEFCTLLIGATVEQFRSTKYSFQFYKIIRLLKHVLQYLLHAVSDTCLQKYINFVKQESRQELLFLHIVFVMFHQ